MFNFRIDLYRCESILARSPEKCAPLFVQKPEPQVVTEGDWAKFQCRVVGHPKPRLIWVLNGNTVVNVSRYFGSVHPHLRRTFIGKTPPHFYRDELVLYTTALNLRSLLHKMSKTKYSIYSGALNTSTGILLPAVITSSPKTEWHISRLRRI